MAYTVSRKILIGKKMYGTWFGLRNQSKGMYSGGFERWLFGVKYIFGVEIEITWGSYNK
ncbi:MAG: hypothetical protein ACJA2M_001342 [Polaribacter sp.]|jgi:hypothetical protein|tara:strand:- start:143 stop:319 length:177 start_codon:yes stop_codon:yes gene_type:complete